MLIGPTSRWPSRIWRGAVVEGNVLNGVRVAGVIRMLGAQHEKTASTQLGDVVGLRHSKPS